jgi:excinuclease ABC subunit B
MTDSMQRAIDETSRRRAKQLEYNREHGIKPDTIRTAIRAGIAAAVAARRAARVMIHESETEFVSREYLARLEEEMHKAAGNLEFERAAAIRDRILALKGEGDDDAPQPAGPPPRRRR